MTTFTFSFRFTTNNVDRLEKLQARCMDFSEPLLRIVSEWALGNKRKFAASRGNESTGVQQFDDVFWEPITSAYAKSKRRKGQADWLMVATGSLMQSLTTEGAFGQYVDEKHAQFGTPMDSEDADKAMYNAQSRRVIFLSRGDRLMIKREIKNYLNFGPGYRDALADIAARKVALEQESAQMAVDFANTVAE